MDTVLADREEEKRKLGAAIDAFAEEMKARAFQKVDEGYTGWDADNWDVESRISRETYELMLVPREPDRTARKCADLANFAMFLWHRTRAGQK